VHGIPKVGSFRKIYRINGESGPDEQTSEPAINLRNSTTSGSTLKFGVLCR